MAMLTPPGVFLQVPQLLVLPFVALKVHNMKHGAPPSASLKPPTLSPATVLCLHPLSSPT